MIPKGAHLIVPFTQTKLLATILHKELIDAKNDGHLNGSTGWLKLQECLDALVKMMN